MRKVLLGLLVPVIALLGIGMARAAENPGFPAELYGTYVGFAAAVASVRAPGECRATIGPKTVDSVIATGRRLVHESVPADQFATMTRDELADNLKPGSDIINRAVGVKRTTNGDYPIFIFLVDDGVDPGASVAVRTGDVVESFFGPRALFTPRQVAAGEFDAAVKEMEKHLRLKDIVPRIEYGGMTKADFEAAQKAQ